MTVLRADPTQFATLDGHSNGVSTIEFVYDVNGDPIIGEEVLTDPDFATVLVDLTALDPIPYAGKEILVTNSLELTGLTSLVIPVLASVTFKAQAFAGPESNNDSNELLNVVCSDPVYVGPTSITLVEGELDFALQFNTVGLQTVKVTLGPIESLMVVVTVS